MRILVDGDACPTKDIIINLASIKNIGVSIYIDTAHEYQSNYAEVILCDKGNDSVDYHIIKNVKENDIVITQDYGLASLVLIKKARVIHNNGFIIDENNISTLLDSRYIGAKERRSNNKIKGPRKRTKDNDILFTSNLRKLLEE